MNMSSAQSRTSMQPQSVVSPPRLFAFATQGCGGNDEARLRALLSKLEHVEFLPFDYSHKVKSAWNILKRVYTERPNLVVLEGTGLWGGMVLILGKCFFRIPYVVSSGDAVAPFVAQEVPWLGPLFWCYEKTLVRFSDGFIGWTPYLAGRALTLGATRVMTAAGWAPQKVQEADRKNLRDTVRRKLHIPEDALVIGIVGSLALSRRVGYCYGSELVRVAHKVSKKNLRVLIVGEGTGRKFLEQLAGKELGQKIILTGNVPRTQVPAMLSAMDIASLPQSVNQVGAFRYSTKLTEYMAAGLPIVMGEVPMSYDLPGDWFWRIPGPSPWSETYISKLASFLDELKPEVLETKKKAVPLSLPPFEKEFQINRVTEFIRAILMRSGCNK